MSCFAFRGPPSKRFNDQGRPLKHITRIAHAWGQERLNGLDYNPYPNTNILHNSKMGKGGSPGHKILCHDPSGKYRAFELAWKSLPTKQRESVEVKFVYGNAVTEDGKALTNRQLAGIIGLSQSAFLSNVKYGLRKIEIKMEST